MKIRIRTILKKCLAWTLSFILLTGTLGLFAWSAFSEVRAASDHFTSWGVSQICATQFMREMPEEDLPTVTVAILDTGVDFNNKYIKDRLLSGYDFINNDSDPSDDDEIYGGRGTHMASVVISATKENVKILPVKVVGSDGSYPSNDILYSAVKYAVDNGADIINMGIAYSTKDKAVFDAWENAIKYATDRDVLCVAAAGNFSKSFDDCLAENTYIVPAMNTNVLTVGNCDSDDVVSHSSNFGSHLEFVAPGVGVEGYLNNNKLGFLNGSAVATPFVSACAALLLSVDNAMTCTEVSETLYERAADKDEYGKDIYYGYGRIHIDNCRSTMSVMQFNVSEEYKHIFLKTRSSVPFTFPEPLLGKNAVQGGFIITSSNPEVARLEKRTDDTRNTLVAYSAGETTITATYYYSKDKTTSLSYTVHVYDEERPEMSIITLPNQLTFKENENIDPAGLSLELIYPDGRREIATEGFIVSPKSAKGVGPLTVTVTYKGLTVTYKVQIEKQVIVELDSISINTLPQKRHYKFGEKLDTTGLIINQVYSDDSYTSIFSGFTCSPESFNTPGKNTVTVSYNGFTCAYDVWVSRETIRSVEINTLPVKTEYYQRDTFDSTGLTLKMNYVDNTSEILTSGFTCIPDKFENVGKQTVKVDLFGLYDTFEVDVAELRVDEATVLTNPVKLSYFVGDTFDATGLSIDVKYNSGETETITEGFTFDSEPFDTAGSQTVTVSYLNRTFDFDVTVEEVTITRIGLSAYPYKLEYHINETLDTTGLKLRVAYSNADVEYISDGFICTPTVLTQKGEQMITVTYGGEKCEFYVLVKEPIPTGISIKTLPEKTVYTVGDTLDTSGLKLEVTYSDGTKKVISEGFTCAPTEFRAASGSQTVTVKYGDFVDTFSVTVNSDTLVEGINIPSELLLYKNDKERIAATITPDNAENQSIIWTSSNQKVAVVDENGIVTATGRGTAVITATTEDGGFTDVCTVTVKYTWWQWIIVILLFGWIWY